MNQFLLQKGNSEELRPFEHILEFAIQRNNAIQLNTLNETYENCFRIYYILEGKLKWIINQQEYILYPGDLVNLQPGQRYSREEEVLDFGKLCWICIDKDGAAANNIIGQWSSLPIHELMAIENLIRQRKTPVLTRLSDAGRILEDLRQEILQRKIGYTTRVNHLLDELFIIMARRLTGQQFNYRDFPQTFRNLEHALRQNLAHQWTVEEMAAFVGLGSTTFTEKAKRYSGFSPLNYLISIRISEAIKLLKQNKLSVTAIALDTGFYSSQHFSTTFKKLTGYTPSDFRKKNLSNEQD